MPHAPEARTTTTSVSLKLLRLRYLFSSTVFKHTYLPCTMHVILDFHAHANLSFGPVSVDSQ